MSVKSRKKQRNDDETFEPLSGLMVPVTRISKSNRSSLWKVSLLADRSTFYACKMIMVYSVPKNEYETMMENLRMVQHLFHPNIIRHLKVYGKPGLKIYVIMDYYERGSIHDVLIQRNGPLEEKQSRIWMAQIIGAISFLHNKGIAHRNVNLQAILVATDTTAVLSGFVHLCFGFQREMEIIRTTVVNEPGYRAPEMHNFSLQIWPYDAKAADMYAVGVCLYRMLTNEWPFELSLLERDPVKYLMLQRKRQFRKSISASAAISDEMKNLINRLLEPMSGVRITAQQALIHNALMPDEIQNRK